jgi:hypothetical protein
MRIERLHDKHNPDVLAEMYAAPHDPMSGVGHSQRLVITAGFATVMIATECRKTVADLSCGKDATVDQQLWRRGGELHLGDMAVLPVEVEATTKHVGPIEDTIDLIPSVDLFVCTETLEHLDAPSDVLGKIRAKADRLLLSTPVNNWEDRDRNLEHYWAWDREAVEAISVNAGWQVESHMELDLRHVGGWYEYGVWVLR